MNYDGQPQPWQQVVDKKVLNYLSMLSQAFLEITLI